MNNFITPLKARELGFAPRERATSRAIYKRHNIVGFTQLIATPQPPTPPRCNTRRPARTPQTTPITATRSRFDPHTPKGTKAQTRNPTSSQTTFRDPDLRGCGERDKIKTWPAPTFPGATVDAPPESDRARIEWGGREEMPGRPAQATRPPPPPPPPQIKKRGEREELGQRRRRRQEILPERERLFRPLSRRTDQPKREGGEGRRGRWWESGRGWDSRGGRKMGEKMDSFEERRTDSVTSHFCLFCLVEADMTQPLLFLPLPPLSLPPSFHFSLFSSFLSLLSFSLFCFHY